MKSPIFSVLYCLLFVTTAFSQAAVYISPSGNDTNSGLSATEPVATVAKALDTVKTVEMKQLQLLEGVHRIEQPIILTPEFSGLHIEGPGTISGGKPVTGWKPYKDGIWQAELPGAKDGKWSFRQIYVDGEPRQRARTPNEGFHRVAGCPEGTPKTVGFFTRCQTFEFKPGDIRADWRNPDDIVVVVYHFWVDTHLPIESVDTEKNIVKFKDKSHLTFTDDFSEDGARYVVENVFEALDAPGEWYLDKPTGVLYYMPKDGEDMSQVEIIVPVVTELVRIEGDWKNGQFAEGIVFHNVSFEHCHFEFPPGNINNLQAAFDVAGAVNFIGAKDCRIEKCTFTNLGTYCIDIQAGSSKIGIHHNRLHNLSAGGIKVSGSHMGASPLGYTKNNVIADNEISHFGLDYPSAVGVVVRYSSGNLIARNHVHHGFYLGISLGWTWGYWPSISRDNVVERNHIHHMGQGMLSDIGGVYTLGKSPGTVIRNNLIHDIEAYSYGGWGIYNDEGTVGVLMENNIVFNTQNAGYQLHYGGDNTVRNNIFAFGRTDQLSRGRGENHMSLNFENNIVYWKEGELFTGDWRNFDYKAYMHPAWPDGSEFRRNFTTNWNVFYNPNLKIEEVHFHNGSFAAWRGRGNDENSVYADPMFVDPDNFDFRLQPGSPALKLGFEPIDLSGVPAIEWLPKQNIY